MTLDPDKWREIPGWPGHYERINWTPPEMERPTTMIDDALKAALSRNVTPDPQ